MTASELTLGDLDDAAGIALVNLLLSVHRGEIDPFEVQRAACDWLGGHPQSMLPAPRKGNPRHQFNHDYAWSDL